MNFLQRIKDTFKGKADATSGDVPTISASAASDLIVLDDPEKSAIFYNVLLFLVPTDQLQMMAYDDYYPAFYYSLRNWGDEKVKNLEEKALSKTDEEFINPGEVVIAEFHALRERILPTLPEWDEAGNMTKPLDAQAYSDAIFDNIDLLMGLRTALNLPIDKNPFIQGGALAEGHLPLKADLKTNTRYGAAYHDEYVEEFLDFIAEAYQKSQRLGLEAQPKSGVKAFLDAPKEADKLKPDLLEGPE